MRKWFKEFKDNDYQGSAVEDLNFYIENNPSYRVAVVEYNVVHYEKIKIGRIF